MFDGFEVDVLSLGDADCILVSQWAGYAVTRLLIDGGKEADYPEVKAFLQSRNAMTIDHIICSHLHNDHAAGLIRLLQDRSIAVKFGWMHNIRNHVDQSRLRRASFGNGGDAENVREVLHNTDRLLAVFQSRGIGPVEPFAGVIPEILGPRKAYYASVVAEFTKNGVPVAMKPQPAFGQRGLIAALAGANISNQFSTIPFFGPPNTLSEALSRMRLSGSRPQGILSRAAVKANPSTQPYNNTSVILGLNFKGFRFLFTADAGCAALRQIEPGWENLYCLQVPHHGSDGNLSKDLVERFRPQIAFVSAQGNDCHPSPAVKNALITVNSRVFSTHYPTPGHLWFWLGSVPPRDGYVAAAPMRGSGGVTGLVRG
jgi:beta-lactamase superfamily II metal-dependent hydrolase